jgi:hypothetical protein
MLAIAHSFWLHDIWHPLNGNGYQFWSGIGSDLSEIVLIGALVAWWRRHNCARHGCWRLSFHPHPEHDVPVCRKHHPKGTL